MKIYCAHNTTINFKDDYYRPLKESSLAQTHQLIFPHETDQFIDSKQIIESCDLVIAEASFPSTGMGIELGWANAIGKRIIAVHHSDTTVSQSLAAITSEILPYSTLEELTDTLINAIGS